jgi:hypothetical protein
MSKALRTQCVRLRRCGFLGLERFADIGHRLCGRFHRREQFLLLRFVLYFRERLYSIAAQEVCETPETCNAEIDEGLR